MASSDRRITRAAAAAVAAVEAAAAGGDADADGGGGARQRIEQGEARNIDIEGEALSLCVVIAHIS
jgi:hypothetical protein